MSQPSKIRFLVQGLVRELSVDECTDSNVDIISKNLIMSNAEFKRIPKMKFKDMVEGTLSDVIKENNTKGNTPRRSLSASNLSSYNTPSSSSNKIMSSSSKSNVVSGVKRKRNSVSDSAIVGSRHEDDNNDDIMKKANFVSGASSVRLSDLAGLDDIIKTVKELIFYPIKLPTLYKQLGVSPPSGLLLHGPSGCGKTTLALAIAGELQLPFHKVSGPELIGGTSGESETRIRELFDSAIKTAPSIIFIDSLDVIATKREASQRGMDRRVIAQLFDSIDDIKNLNKIKRVNNNEKRDCDIEQKSNTYDEKLKDDEMHGEPQVQEDFEDEGLRKHVILIAATDKPDNLDLGVRGRFSKEIALPVPDAPSRSLIIKMASSDMMISDDVDFGILGKNTPGFVGADLQALCQEAGVTAIKRIISSFPTSHEHGSICHEMIEDLIKKERNIPSSQAISAQTNTEVTGENEIIKKMKPSRDEDQESAMIMNELNSSENLLMSLSQPTLDNIALSVTMNDFLIATKNIQPSAKREGFAVVPDVSWDDVGALSAVRQELLDNVIEPITHPDRYIRLGLEVPAGVLFFGPPGCGKTLLAKALSNQSGANFISVKGPELLNMYVGESESKVRQVFTRARASAPCVIFFDELDALCPRRGMGPEGGSGVSERVVNQLLTELDGLETRKDVYVIAATNRLELIDDAMLRPGRLGKLLYVPLPSSADRGSILKAVSRKISIDDDVDLDSLGSDSRADGFSGADLAALVREAGMAVMQDWRANMSGDDSANGSVKEACGESLNDSFFKISTKHFECAFGKVKASVNVEDRKRYERVHELINIEGFGAIEALRRAREEFS